MRYRQTARAKLVRANKSRKLEMEIITKLNIFKSDIRIAKQILSKNNITGSVALYKRLKDINNQIDNGTFKIQNRVKRNSQFKGLDFKNLKVYDVIALVNRTDFYKEEKELITSLQSNPTKAKQERLLAKSRLFRQKQLDEWLKDFF